ncbi:hypothetical protein ACLKA6_008254 [Drosophila palustris]
MLLQQAVARTHSCHASCLVPHSAWSAYSALRQISQSQSRAGNRLAARSSQLESRMLRMGHSLQIFFVAAAAASVFARFPTDAVQHLSAP